MDYVTKNVTSSQHNLLVRTWMVTVAPLISCSSTPEATGSCDSAAEGDAVAADGAVVLEGKVGGRW